MASQKDYQKMADILAGEIACYPNDIDVDIRLAIRRVALSTADMFAQDNPRFNRARFYVACGLTEDGEL